MMQQHLGTGGYHIYIYINIYIYIYLLSSLEVCATIVPDRCKISFIEHLGGNLAFHLYKYKELSLPLSGSFFEPHFFRLELY